MFEKALKHLAKGLYFPSIAWLPLPKDALSPKSLKCNTFSKKPKTYFSKLTLQIFFHFFTNGYAMRDFRMQKSITE